MDKQITVAKTAYSKWWPWRMAWRDSRKSRGKLLLFITSISLGIAAMVGITSFRENLMGEIDEQAKALLGADVEVSSNRPLPDSLVYVYRSLTAAESREAYFASMVYFPSTDGTRLTQVRALEGAYPYYGAIETEPAEAATKFKTGQYAIVDEKLMIQYNVEHGDSVRVGKMGFEIIGTIKQIPGQSSIQGGIAPVVYIPYEYIQPTGLVQKGSRINYKSYYQFHPEIDTTNLWGPLAKTTEDKGYDVETIEERKEETGEAFNNLSNFLELVAFTALMLGCLGVASAIYVYVKSKVQIVAVLRCLGMRANQAIGIYLIQVSGFGLFGAILGSLLGFVLHMYLPSVVKDFVPIEIVPSPYWPAVFIGIVLGIIISLLFGLLSLISLRKISPLSAIRMGFETGKFQFDRWLIPILGGVVMFIFLSVYWQIGSALDALIFSGILIATILLLFGIGKGMSWLTRKLVPASLPYVWRQGFSNLYRPNNQTVILITTLGLGTAFLATLYFMQDLLIERVSLAEKGERPNTILFDIQTDQKDELRELTEDYDLPVMQEVPIVTMRLLEVNGYNKDDAWNDSTFNVPNWAYNREYRVTYREELIDSETLVEGEWNGNLESPQDSIFISMSKGFAENLELEIGDELLFNVQGALITTYVGSFREVDWRRVQTNFIVLFPAGVLEQAPQFHVLVTRIDKSDLSARYQQAVVRSYPNVSIIDLELILKTLEEVLAKVAFVIRFMAFFSIGTGLIVMISSIILSKFQRVRENVLLRTLGASKNQLWAITVAEYFFLGALGAVSGIFLAALFSTLLGTYVFEFPFVPDPVKMVVIFVAVAGISVTIGLLNSRDVLRQSPLEVLRNEA